MNLLAHPRPIAFVSPPSLCYSAASSALATPSLAGSLPKNSCRLATFLRRTAESAAETPVAAKACGIFVRQPDKAFLLLKHRNRLDIPKGHMEEGETELQTAFRELQEETGIRSEDVILDPKFRFEYSYMLPRRIAKGYGALNVRKDLVIFMATLRSASVLSRIRTTEEHPLGYMWYTWRPPHNIQPQTIDPLLKAVAAHYEVLEGPMPYTPPSFVS